MNDERKIADLEAKVARLEKAAENLTQAVISLWGVNVSPEPKRSGFLEDLERSLKAVIQLFADGKRG